MAVWKGHDGEAEGVFLLLEPVHPPYMWKGWIRVRRQSWAKVVNKGSALSHAKEPRTLEDDRVDGRRIIAWSVHFPAFLGVTNIPKRDHAVTSCPSRNVTGGTSTTGNGVNGFLRPFV